MIPCQLLELVILNLKVTYHLGVKIVFGFLGQILNTRIVAANDSVRAVFTCRYQYQSPRILSVSHRHVIFGDVKINLSGLNTLMS